MYSVWWFRKAGLGFLVLLGWLVSAPSHAQESLPVLTQQLAGRSFDARLLAVAKIGMLGSEGRSAAPALVAALKCERIDAITGSGPQFSALRHQIGVTLSGLATEIAPLLRESLHDRNGLVRVWSAFALLKARGQGSDDALRVLIEALQQTPEVAADAGMALELSGDLAGGATKALVERLEGDDFAVRAHATLALAAVAPTESQQELRLLIRAGGVAGVCAAFALQRVIPSALEEALLAIKRGLQGATSAERVQAVWAIGQMGPRAVSLAGDLVDSFERLQLEPSAYWFGQLGRLGMDPAMALLATEASLDSKLENLLSHKSRRVQVMAATALVQRDAAHIAVARPVLQAAMKDRDRDVSFVASRVFVLQILAREPEVGPLIEALQLGMGFSPVPMVLAQRGDAALVPLREVMLSGDGRTARGASNALAAMGPAAIPTLGELMTRKNDGVRLFAATALGTMGTPALALLAAALQDESYAVRRVARYGLKAIGTEAALQALQKPKRDGE
ncbi:MAG: HEAT repeat domain-containing protein [Planctomycetota bacterium]|nr:HEAT repeat domain-containing protein [Planctomycetota bacterium]